MTAYDSITLCTLTPLGPQERKENEMARKRKRHKQTISTLSCRCEQPLQIIQTQFPKNDPPTDRLPTKNHLRSLTMNRRTPTSKKIPLPEAPKGRLLIERRNMSKTSFEDSATSNELRMAFEVHPNKFELPIRLCVKNFECLRILGRRSSNNFELLRMIPALPPG